MKTCPLNWAIWSIEMPYSVKVISNGIFEYIFFKNKIETDRYVYFRFWSAFERRKKIKIHIVHRWLMLSL